MSLALKNRSQGQQPYRGICAMRLFPPPVQRIVDRLELHNVDLTDVHLRSPGVFCICDLAPLAASMKLAKEPAMSNESTQEAFTDHLCSYDSCNVNLLIIPTMLKFASAWRPMPFER